MPRITKSEIAQDLTDLFPVLEPRSLSPDEVSATLQLVHDLLPGTHKFRRMQFESVTGAAAATSVVGSATPPDRYRYIQAADIGSNDSVAHFYSIAVLGGATPGSASTNVVSDVAAVLRNVQAARLALGRSMLLGPGQQFVGTANAMSAGTSLLLNFYFVEMLILDPHPAL